jgi:hypothetical protein
MGRVLPLALLGLPPFRSLGRVHLHQLAIFLEASKGLR